MSESRIITDEKLPNIHPGEILKEDFFTHLRCLYLTVLDESI